MENCLVTKLKGVVDNPNLPKLGEMRLALQYSSTYFDLRSIENQTVKVISGDLLIGGESEITIAPQQTSDVHALSGTSGVISIEDKYKLTYIAIDSPVMGYEKGMFKYLSNLNTLSVHFRETDIVDLKDICDSFRDSSIIDNINIAIGDLYGNYSYLANLPITKLALVQTAKPNMEGTFDDLGLLPNCIQYKFCMAVNCGGSILGFVQKKRSCGAISGSCTFDRIGQFGNIKLKPTDETFIEATNNATISWTTDTASFNGTPIV